MAVNGWQVVPLCLDMDVRLLVVVLLVRPVLDRLDVANVEIAFQALAQVQLRIVVDVTIEPLDRVEEHDLRLVERELVLILEVEVRLVCFRHVVIEVLDFVETRKHIGKHER